MEKLLTKEEYERMTAEYNKVRYRCECGYRVIIPEWVDKKLCKHCGKYVFKTKEDEFKYRVKEKILRR